jgi:DNA-binding transcriptional LysR family regulator
VIHQWSNWVELLSYMRVFVEVARTKSFRRAADALDMPNSTLSRHIAELEKTIGLRLLHRSTRKVELTEAGEVYFKRCQSIVEEARIAHESLLDVVERPRHVVCIVEGATKSGEVARTFYCGDASVDVMTGTRFAMNSVALNRGLAIHGVGLAVLDDVLAWDDVTLGRLVRVLPDWSLAPVQVHAVTETRLLPARTRLFIDFLRTRLRKP